MILRVLAVVLAAGLVGAGVGVLARTSARAEPGRPARVEQALRALDAWQRRGELAPLREAAQALGDPATIESPWADEAELVRVAAAGDAEALWRFATEGVRGPARARALLLLAARGPDAATRERAVARLRADYPASWAARSPGALR